MALYKKLCLLCSLCLLMSYASRAQEANPEAIARLVSRAKGGDASAQYELGRAYLYGIGLGQSNEDAVYWLEKSAAAGNKEAQGLLGVMLVRGWAVKYDAERGLALLTSSADAGCVPAQYELGAIYYYGLVGSVRIERGKYYLTKAAEAGDVYSQWLLGELFERYGGADGMSQAYGWYSKAAEGGLPRAMVKVGDFLVDGKTVEANYPTALRMYRQALVAGGEKPGLPALRIADMYRGGLGVPKDTARAAQLYLAAANANVAEAQFKIAQMLAEGIGCQKDVVEALKWYCLAASAGHDGAYEAGAYKGAYEAGQELANKVSIAELDEAMKRAENWRKDLKPLQELVKQVMAVETMKAGPSQSEEKPQEPKTGAEGR